MTQKLEDRKEDEKKKASLRERMRQHMKEKLASRDEEYPPSPDADAVSSLQLGTHSPDAGEMSPTRLSTRHDSRFSVLA